MHSLTLNNDNRGQLAAALADGRWIVASLCAGWCGTCATYRATFEQLAERHPDKFFVWIDIEDQADLVGDLDVENFPTLLLQRGAQVSFFGTTVPDAGVAQRLIVSTTEHSAEELARLAASSAERRHWQQECELGALLDAAAD